MKHILTAASLLMATASYADNFTPTSKVTAVTAFNKGGIVTRQASLDIPAGMHTITFRGGAFARGVEYFETLFPAGSGVQVVSTQFKEDDLEPNRPEKSDEYKRRASLLKTAQTALDAFDAEISKDEALVASGTVRMDFLLSLTQRPMGPFTQGNTVDPAQMATFITTIGDQMQAAQQDVKKANARIAARKTERVDLLNARDDAATALALVAADPEGDDTQVTLTINAASPFKGILELRTFADVLWRPYYKLMLDQTKDKGQLKIERKVMLSQRSGEDWSDVTVTVSTANLTNRLRAYPAYPDIKYLVSNYYAGTKGKSKSMLKSTADAGAWGDEPRQDEIVMEKASPSIPMIKGQTIEYRLANPVSLQSGLGGFAIFALDVIETPVNLFAQANSATDKTAYLYAELENNTGGNILAGRAVLFRDGAYVGEGSFPPITQGDKTDLALGPLDGLRVERLIISREDGDRGIISSSNTHAIRYETKVDSLLPYAIDLRLLYVMPTSEAEDLVITEYVSPKPTVRNVDGQRGVLRWDVTVQAGSSQTVQVGYDMVWPEGSLVH